MTTDITFRSPRAIADVTEGTIFATVDIAAPIERVFAALHDQVPEVVGNCVDNVRYDGISGDGLQTTSTGLLVWRKNDNLTAFTDGNQTWLDGPFGLTRAPASST